MQIGQFCEQGRRQRRFELDLQKERSVEMSAYTARGAARRCTASVLGSALGPPAWARRLLTTALSINTTFHCQPARPVGIFLGSGNR